MATTSDPTIATLPTPPQSTLSPGEPITTLPIPPQSTLSPGEPITTLPTPPQSTLSPGEPITTLPIPPIPPMEVNNKPNGDSSRDGSSKTTRTSQEQKEDNETANKIKDEIVSLIKDGNDMISSANEIYNIYDDYFHVRTHTIHKDQLYHYFKHELESRDIHTLSETKITLITFNKIIAKFIKIENCIETVLENYRDFVDNYEDLIDETIKIFLLFEFTVAEMASDREEFFDKHDIVDAINRYETDLDKIQLPTEFINVYLWIIHGNELSPTLYETQISSEFDDVVVYASPGELLYPSGIENMFENKPCDLINGIDGKNYAEKTNKPGNFYYLPGMIFSANENEPDELSKHIGLLHIVMIKTETGCVIKKRVELIPFSSHFKIFGDMTKYGSRSNVSIITLMNKTREYIHKKKGGCEKFVIGFYSCREQISEFSHLASSLPDKFSLIDDYPQIKTDGELDISINYQPLCCPLQLNGVELRNRIASMVNDKDIQHERCSVNIFFVLGIIKETLCRGTSLNLDNRITLFKVYDILYKTHLARFGSYKLSPVTICRINDTSYAIRKIIDTLFYWKYMFGDTYIIFKSCINTDRNTGLIYVLLVVESNIFLIDPTNRSYEVFTGNKNIIYNGIIRKIVYFENPPIEIIMINHDIQPMVRDKVPDNFITSFGNPGKEDENVNKRAEKIPVNNRGLITYGELHENGIVYEILQRPSVWYGGIINKLRTSHKKRRKKSRGGKKISRKNVKSRGGSGKKSRGGRKKSKKTKSKKVYPK